MDPISEMSIAEVPVGDLEGVRPSQRHSRIEDEVIKLFEQYRGALLRYCLSLGISVHDGEEIIQETFLALFRHLHLDRSRSNLTGWIFRVAHNLTLKQRYAGSRMQAHQGTSNGTVGELLDPTPSPEEIFFRTRRRERLVAVVQALPVEDRSCLLLRAEGLRYREIADAMGISLGAVSKSLTRSLARLERADRR